MNLLRHSVLSAGLHRITAVIFALSLIFTLSAFASDFYTVDTVPNPRLENTSFHVSDPATLLTHDTVSYLNEKLTQLEKDTDIQSAVVVLPSVGDSDVFEFSQELFRKWGIGQRDKMTVFCLPMLKISTLSVSIQVTVLKVSFRMPSASVYSSRR